ncbi:unnamed protein product [Heligmosomoides polygyrus]|uniref:Apple domain-containing protein n=1 Tax=Heligmosomoides polygyrus TaxID=6339 RepID=A0A3P7XWS5_HELPZ|nr:unnamed protein product [Heligmosomoides polygyrus]
MGSLRASTFVFATALMCAVFHLSNGLCRRNFFAQPVIYDKAMGIDFYFTGIGVPSVSACAEFCGARRFCRTAIFNSYTKTCAISYEYTLNCRYNKNRFTDFDVRQTTSNLIQVACVTKCGDDYMALMPPGKYRPLGMDTLHRPPKMLKKVELITGDPHDGKNLGRVLTEKESRVFVGTGTRTLKAKSNNGAPLAIQALINSALPVDDGFLGLLTKRGRSQVCFRTIESRYLLGGAFEQHTTSSLDECRSSLILAACSLLFYMVAKRGHGQKKLLQDYAQRRLERSILGVRLGDKIRSRVIRHRSVLKDWIPHALKRMWLFANKLCRTERSWARIAADWISDKKRSKGRPRRRWLDDRKIQRDKDKRSHEKLDHSD